MPTLPTFDVTDAQAQRLIAAFGTVDNYKAWLKKNLMDYVLNKEANDLFDEHISQGRDALGYDLPPP